ncbi:hypothetical protein PsorP6_000246 [Peronosclerospora sorghi]|uniref:Uncharacterized protein n=1 Tax=Peronosclerospora sorghi TaxID=230839 RepID=A0ACC0WRK3_9STRA|nr:hypothetical protein PsorP6_000246 [Peronosclerospora sorghi]
MDHPSEIRLSNPPVHVTLASLTDTASDHYKDNTNVPLLLDAGTVDAPMVAVAAKVDMEDDSTAAPSPTAAGANVDRQPRLVDVEVDSNAPPTETAADAKIEAEFDLVEAPLGVEAKPSFQIKTTIALVPDAVKKSTEDSHFLTKHHTKVVKTTQPITVAEKPNR